MGFPDDDLPADILLAARAQLADTLAVGLAASEADGAAGLRTLAQAWGGGGQAGLIGAPIRVAPPMAALANGAMMHALDFDDTHAEGFVHPGAVVVSTALAAANWRSPVDGAALLGATAIGTEVMCRLGVAFPGPDKAVSGWHFTPLLGTLVSALVAARLGDLSLVQAGHAMGLAYHQTAGNMQGLVDGALAKRLGPGLAAHHGLLSAGLATEGLTGAREVLEGRFGLFRQYGRAEPVQERLLDGLGERFESRAVFIKPYPCCALVHPFIDAALRLREDPAFDPAALVAVEARRGPAAELVCAPEAVKQRPRNVVDAQFSAPWGIAAALVRGSVGLNAYTAAALDDVDLARIAGLVRTPTAPEFARGAGIEPVALTAILSDGRRLQAQAGVGPADPEAQWQIAIRKLQSLPFGTSIAEAVAADKGPDLARLAQLLFRPLNLESGGLEPYLV